MDILSLVLIAVGLAMDAFAVSICKGLAMKRPGMRSILIIGLWFGFFQALMPVIGYYLGSAFYDYISDFDHWIAFILLAHIRHVEMNVRYIHPFAVGDDSPDCHTADQVVLQHLLDFEDEAPVVDENAVAGLHLSGKILV